MQNENILFFFLIIFFLNSCSIEEKAALKSQKDIQNTTVLLYAQPELYKYNTKVNIPDDIPDEEYDRLYLQSMDSSDFIADIDIDAYWIQFHNEIQKNIINSGFIYLSSDSITEFIDKDKPKFIFDIKQIELDEHRIFFVDTIPAPYEGFGYFDENYSKRVIAKDFEAIIENYEVEIPRRYYNDDAPPPELKIPSYNTHNPIVNKYSEIQIIKPINAASINFWIEVNSYLKNQVHRRELIFISRSMEDIVTNDVNITYDDLLNIQAWYRFSNLGYKIDSIDIDKIWLNSGVWSREVTDILNSYMVNKIIEDYIHNASDTKYRKRFWIFNAKTGRILPTDNTPEYKILEQYEAN